MWYTSYVTAKRKTAPAAEPALLPTEGKQGKRVPAIFFRTEGGGEPLREWLKSLPSPEDRKLIGEDIKTVEFGWPVGMPVCRSLGGGICEIRTHLKQDRIARVLFYIDAKERMVLLHGFIKKTQKTPLNDLELARRNKSKHERGLSQ
jgi:phage-related protein